MECYDSHLSHASGPQCPPRHPASRSWRRTEHRVPTIGVLNVDIPTPGHSPSAIRNPIAKPWHSPAASHTQTHTPTPRHTPAATQTHTPTRHGTARNRA